MKIHDRIKALREDLRYSQYDLAEKLNISQSAYLQIEKGKTEVTISRLTKLAEAFGVPLIKLLGIEDTALTSELHTQIDLLKTRLNSLEELNKYYLKYINQYEQLADYLFQKIDRKMILITYEAKILTKKELGPYLKESEVDGVKTVNLVLDYLDHGTTKYQPYVSKLLNERQIYMVLYLLSRDHSEEYNTLINMFHIGILPENNLKRALHNRFNESYFTILEEIREEAERLYPCI
jgi:transcriptional regulator with XRE-family HTH domain